jgi:hypothetical protein
MQVTAPYLAIASEMLTLLWCPGRPARLIDTHGLF